jgi:hypothetical protein
MLTLTILGTEVFNNDTQEFDTVGDIVVDFEHSLISLSLWESKWEKSFLGYDEKSAEEILSYIQCMTLTPNIAPEVLNRLSESNLNDINNYINSKMSATWFRDDATAPKSSETITSELIYYWLTVFNIPFECETWHLNRLFTLIKICNLKSAKPKKMSRNELAQRNRDLNAQRKAQLNTSG